MTCAALWESCAGRGRDRYSGAGVLGVEGGKLAAGGSEESARTACLDLIGPLSNSRSSHVIRKAVHCLCGGRRNGFVHGIYGAGCSGQSIDGAIS